MENLSIKTSIVINEQFPDSYNIDGEKIDRIEKDKKIGIGGEEKNE